MFVGMMLHDAFLIWILYFLVRSILWEYAPRHGESMISGVDALIFLCFSVGIPVPCSACIFRWFWMDICVILGFIWEPFLEPGCEQIQCKNWHRKRCHRWCPRPIYNLRDGCQEGVVGGQTSLLGFEGKLLRVRSAGRKEERRKDDGKRANSD